MTLIDLVASLSDSELPKVLDELKAFSDWQSAPNAGPPPEFPICVRYVRTFQSSELGNPELPIWVDLSADDDLLIERFSSWLAEARREFGGHVKQLSWSERSRQAWIDYRVLAFIDLNIYCARVANANLKQSLAGALLFPDEADIDLTERIRKVVIPMTERLLSDEFLAALTRRADEAERLEASNRSGTTLPSDTSLD